MTAEMAIELMSSRVPDRSWSTVGANETAATRRGQ